MGALKGAIEYLQNQRKEIKESYIEKKKKGTRFLFWAFPNLKTDTQLEYEFLTMSPFKYDMYVYNIKGSMIRDFEDRLEVLEKMCGDCVQSIS